MKVFINLRIVAISEDDIASFLQFCGLVQHLGDIGSSRNIPVVVDGDGSGKFSFYVNDERLALPLNIDDVDIDNLPEIWLGE